MRRPLRVALAACVLFAAPATLLAQSTQSTTQQPPNVRQIPPPNVRQIPPVRRPRPAPTGSFAHRPHQRNSVSYPIVIDGSVMDRYLTVTPTPKPKRTPATRTPSGEDVFETHSSDDAK